MKLIFTCFYSLAPDGLSGAGGEPFNGGVIGGFHR